uniref:Miraculin-like n=1 Tax=Tanacetum cinerariifolium TaxID=118510 RepID=A0A6L2K277_TANCI|nr:miraculin-like [Tanacetum cinerariifolium]
MKFINNLLLFTFLSFYLASSQPLQTTITTTTSAFDADGQEVQPGIKYYIAPSQSNDSGGGLSLASRDGFCPPFVVQENSHLSKGLSLRFLPLDTKQNAITLSSDLNVVFNAATICVQSTVWRLSSGGGSGSGTDDMVTGRRYFVRSGGVVGRPGVGTNLLRPEDEEHEESYWMLKLRERRQLYVHDYSEEYCEMKEYGDLVVKQRLQMVHWIMESFNLKVAKMLRPLDVLCAVKVVKHTFSLYKHSLEQCKQLTRNSRRKPCS